MEKIIEWICPIHQIPFIENSRGFSCLEGCFYETYNNIPRFVDTKNYANAFGYQWNKFRTTQLDSITGLSISRDRLTRIAGGNLELFQGKKILEAGCGAGRFTEIMLSADGQVVAIDLSNAVEANFQNCSHFLHYEVAQADILNLPLAKNQFDVVVCIGVIQHTPDPETTIKALCSYLKSGGILLLDHYTQGYPITGTRRFLRSFLKEWDVRFSMFFVNGLVRILWPFHRLSFRFRYNKFLMYLRQFVLKFSPVVDYQDSYPSLGNRRILEWAILDTYDTLTDKYKHLRSAEQIQITLASLGMDNINVKYAGNGVEAKSIKATL